VSRFIVLVCEQIK